MAKIPYSEVTPEHIYLNRRKFMVGAGSAASLAVLAACVGSPGAPAASGDASVATASPGAPAASGDASVATASPAAPPPSDLPPQLANDAPTAAAATDELGDPLNTYEEITNYNNYYEFTTNKQSVAKKAKDFEPFPWQVEVTGLVDKPATFSFEDLVTQFPQEERIYRLRCVEAWSMVIPWVGFPISRLLEAVQPTSEAKFVKFTTVDRPEQMPGQRSRILNWPYVEGLRLDEAMHPLAIFATGMYGKLLTNQNGAPIRMVVPWKYGFKSIKSIVKIELTDVMPTSTWMAAAPNEFGFYSNVNPNVDPSRWSQGSERRIGENRRRPTLMFNGYEDEVAYLYEGMDLRENF